MQENSVKSSRSVEVLSRKEAKLSESLDKRLRAYVLAAGAAGAILAAPSAASADIITTHGLSYRINPFSGCCSSAGLTIGGITDFRFFGGGFVSTSVGGGFFTVDAFANVFGTNGGELTGLLGKHVRVGKGLKFGGITELGSAFERFAGTYYCNSNGCKTNFRTNEAFADGLGSGYLGLRFSVDGQFHYGWARVNARGAAGTGLAGFASVSGTLGPIAYDTVAGQTILTGQTTTTTPEPATLSLLALGAAGLGIWRRKKAA